MRFESLSPREQPPSLETTTRLKETERRALKGDLSLLFSMLFELHQNDYVFNRMGPPSRSKLKGGQQRLLGAKINELAEESVTYLTFRYFELIIGLDEKVAYLLGAQKTPGRVCFLIRFLREKEGVNLPEEMKKMASAFGLKVEQVNERILLVSL